MSAKYSIKAHRACLDGAADQDQQRTAIRRRTSEQALHNAFLLAMQGDLTKPATLTQTGAQVLEDALSSRDFMQRAMVILADVSCGRTGTQRAAAQLLEEAGARWAWSNAE